jgi:nucleoside-diphosphate-sugar epimerase
MAIHVIIYHRIINFKFKFKKVIFMNILVTGGRGFIGKRLVEALMQKGFQFDVLSRSEVDDPTSRDRSTVLIKGDLIDPQFDFEVLASKYDVIFNCSGELHDEALMQSLHVDAIKHFVRACKVMAKSQNKSIHWVQLSSVGAYGPSRPVANVERVVTEETLTNPIGMYEVTKTLADELIIQASKDGWFTYSILRPSNVFGKDMPNSSIRQLGRMIRSNLFFYIGKPGAVSNYVHVDDVAEALALCGFDSRAKNQVFNLSNDCPQEHVFGAMAIALASSEPKIRINERLIRFFVFLFSWLKWFPLKKSRVEALVNRTHYPNDKIHKLLGFVPSRDVTKTISEVLLNNKVER